MIQYIQKSLRRSSPFMSRILLNVTDGPYSLRSNSAEIVQFNFHSGTEKLLNLFLIRFPLPLQLTVSIQPVPYLVLK